MDRVRLSDRDDNVPQLSDIGQQDLGE